MSYEKVLRETADEFVMAVSVIAEREGLDPGVLTVQALGDALARLTESGALGEEEK